MTSLTKETKINKFDVEQLEWAVNLIEREYSKELRNTPEKMAKLIAADFDVVCGISDIYRFFGLDENYELESKKIGV